MTRIKPLLISVGYETDYTSIYGEKADKKRSGGTEHRAKMVGKKRADDLCERTAIINILPDSRGGRKNEKLLAHNQILSTALSDPFARHNRLVSATSRQGGGLVSQWLGEDIQKKVEKTN